MQQRKSQSCLGRLVTSAIMFVVSMLVGGLVIFVIKWIYPSVNPILNNLLNVNQVPYTPDILWGFWAAVPCVISMGFSVIVSLAFNAITSRRKKAA